VGLIAFGLAFLARRIGSLASLAGLFSAAAAHVVIHGVRGTHLVFGALLVLVVLFRHEANIDALLQEKERGF
jgi:glycerol-3-phosphate acyltransferase PlsY